MPYMIVEKDDGEFCVHKMMDGKPEGESLGCHPNRAEAEAQMASLHAKEPDMMGKGFVVKAVEGGKDNEVEILVPNGGPYGKGVDAVNDYFTPETDYSIPGLPDLPRPVYYFHALDDPQKADVIGTAVSFRDSPEGRWYRVVLDKTKQKAKQSLEAMAKGMLRASSQAILSLVRRVATDIGEKVTHWPLVELSLIDERESGKRAANPFAVVQPAYAKASLANVGLAFTGGETAEGETPPDQPKQKQDTKPTKSTIQIVDRQGKRIMDEKELQEQIAKQTAEAVKAALEAKEKEDQAKADAEAKIEQDKKDAIAEALKARDEEDAAKRRLPGGGEAPYVAKFSEIAKYDSMEPADLALMIEVQNSVHAARPKVAAASESAYKALAVKVGEDKTSIGAVGQSALKARGVNVAAMKSDEIMQQDLAGFGDEWVGVMYSQSLWEKIRQDTFVLQNLPAVEVPEGHESIVIPLEGADPTFYKVAEVTDLNATTGRPNYTIPSSRSATNKGTLSLVKMGARTVFSGELGEDSLIPFMPQLRAQFVKGFAEQMEHVIIDGDTATGATTNINDIGGTPAGTEAFLLVNGFRKSPLVTTTANSRSGGTLAVEDYLDTVKLMGLAGANAIRKDKVAFITDLHVQWKTLELAEVKTRDVFSAPTIENGSLSGIFGYKVYGSAFMHYANQDATYGLKANTAGKTDLDTAANNTTGSILAVRWDQWLFGWRRRLTIETERWPESDANQLSAIARFGLLQRDTEASAITYNLTV